VTGSGRTASFSLIRAVSSIQVPRRAIPTLPAERWRYSLPLTFSVCC